MNNIDKCALGIKKPTQLYLRGCDGGQAVAGPRVRCACGRFGRLAKTPAQIFMNGKRNKTA